MKMSEFITYTHDKLDEVEEGYPKLEMKHKASKVTFLFNRGMQLTWGGTNFCANTRVTGETIH